MIGAIFGDIVGSVYEHRRIKTTKFPLFSPGSRFTDDTVLTVATADAILTGASFAEKYFEYYHLYPNAGYGGMFHRWAAKKGNPPYNSWGNGSAMRISPVGFAFDDVKTTLREAQRSAETTHNHPEGVLGAKAVAAAVFLARNSSTKDEIREYIESSFGYDLSAKLDDIRPGYSFDVSCRGSVPESIIAFLESESCEDAVRKAVSLGGDSDTMACIAGGIAEAFYGGLPADLEERTLGMLDDRLKSVVFMFRKSFPR